MEDESEETTAKREYLAYQRRIGHEIFKKICQPGNPVFELSRAPRDRGAAAARKEKT